jgi:hypothetical protein
MYELISQPIPGGCYTQEEQIALCLEVIRTAAQHLKFAGIDELKTALAQMQESLMFIAAAGLLSDITFTISDPQGSYGVQATISPYDVADYEEVDLSRLRLLANPEAPGSIEIGCVECAFAQEIAGTDWLPEATEVLSCTLVSRGETLDTIEYQEEKSDGDNNDDETCGGFAGEDDRLYDEHPHADRLQD